MDRALRIPEIVSAIVETFTNELEPQDPETRPNDTTPVSHQLAQIARVARVWWEPAIHGLYREVNDYHVNLLLSKISYKWESEEMLNLVDEETTRKKFHRFLQHARHVHKMRIYIEDEPDFYQPQIKSRCKTSSLQNLAKLRAVHSLTRAIFPNLAILCTSVRTHVALRSAVVLLHPRLELYSCSTVAGAIPYIPNFLIALGRHAPNVKHIRLWGAIPQSDFSDLAISLGAFDNLEEFQLFCPMSSYPVLKALHRLRNLEHISLNFNGKTDLIQRPLCFPNVWGISLRGDLDGIVDFLGGADLPTLFAVCLGAENASSTRWNDIIRTLWHRAPNLSSFEVEIGEVPLVDWELPEADRPTIDFVPVDAFPGLTNLSIIELRRRDSFISDRRYGIDEEALARIQLAWPALRTLSISHESWLDFPNLLPPLALSFQHIVDAVILGARCLEETTLMVILTTIPNFKLDTTATYGYLTLSRTAPRGVTEKIQPSGKASVSASLKWEESDEAGVHSKTFSFDFECDYESGNVTCRL